MIKEIVKQYTSGCAATIEYDAETNKVYYTTDECGRVEVTPFYYNKGGWYEVPYSSEEDLRRIILKTTEGGGHFRWNAKGWE